MTNAADAFYVFYFFGSIMAVGMSLILLFAKPRE